MRGFIYTVLLGCFCVNLSAQSKLSFSTIDYSGGEPGLKENEVYSNVLNKISFELIGGLIFLDAELNGTCDQYILDTGAPNLILNSGKQSNSRNTEYVAGISGKVPIVAKRVKGFRMGAIRKKSLLAYYTDIDHLEKVKKRPVKGLIGVDAFRNKEVLLNYQDREMIILPRKRKEKQLGEFEEVYSAKFRKQGHIPVIRLKIGKRNYYFGIDTGAEVNIISKHLLKKIKKENIVLSESQKMIRGIDKNNKVGMTGRVRKLSMKEKEFHNMDFVFADISHINQSHDISLDGILGYPFLSAGIFSIDFRRNKLFVWEKNNTPKPKSPLELVAVDEENE